MDSYSDHPDHSDFSPKLEEFDPEQSVFEVEVDESDSQMPGERVSLLSSPVRQEEKRKLIDKGTDLRSRKYNSQSSLQAEEGRPSDDNNDNNNGRGKPRSLIQRIKSSITSLYKKPHVSRTVRLPANVHSNLAAPSALPPLSSLHNPIKDQSESDRSQHHHRLHLNRQSWNVASILSYIPFLSSLSAPSIPKTSINAVIEPQDAAALWPNVVRNQKYSVITFIPVVLWHQFSYFFNLYFLLVALSQLFPALRVGFLFTYIAPLAFVLAVTMIKEAYDDIQRFRRDREANSQIYKKLTYEHGWIDIPSSEIKVGDFIVVHSNQRVPADGILLRTTEKGGASFIRTDSLDGETDWKLRHAVACCQRLQSDAHLFTLNAMLQADAPRREIYEFIGNFTRYNDNGTEAEVEPLSLENTLWTNTVLATGTVILLIAYTGNETRSAMNTEAAPHKVGKLDRELNTMSKLLFALSFIIAFVMVAFRLFAGNWAVDIFRFIVLFSNIIPISMRINLDISKTVCSLWMTRDPKIRNTVARNSNIPEELGRIEYLFSDKTGTLTRNEMVFKKLHLGSIMFGKEAMDEVRTLTRAAFESDSSSSSSSSYGQGNGKAPMMEQQGGSRQRNNNNNGNSNSFFGNGVMLGDFDARHVSAVRDAVLAMALCHNVTPVIDPDTGARSYQAASPDEIALVQYTESVGVTLFERQTNSITLQMPDGHSTRTYDILQIFPFTSETKRMGIITQDRQDKSIMFYMKGADVIMSRIVTQSDWLEEETENMAREGLRTLVFGCKPVSQQEYDQFAKKYHAARAQLQDRNAAMRRVIEALENDLQLLAVTGVEDRLQDDVKPSLEMLRNAGVKIWMLTGDKVETATCIARSSRLVARNQPIFQLLASNEDELSSRLTALSMVASNSAIVMDGNTLAMCLEEKELEKRWVSLACQSPAVVVSRCSPTQKAAVVRSVREFTGKHAAAIGDGGNDVAMICSADAGIGIVGKEGKQASLAADFSIDQFSYVTRLLLWHGRNSYKRSALLAQFVIHRGLIISVIQAVFSAIFFFAPISLFTGWLLVGYATVYTAFPVLCLILDEDVPEDIVFLYPELYRELQKGRSLSLKTFLICCWKAVYQGCVMMLLAISLFESFFLRLISVSFTALILTELLMVFLEVHKVTKWMLISEAFSITGYMLSIIFLPGYIDLPFLATVNFWWKVSILVLASTVPVYLGKIYKRTCHPPSYTKLT